MEPMDFGDLLAKTQAGRRELLKNGKGRWRFTQDGFIGCDEPAEYFKPITDLNDSAHILDFLTQLATKTWVSSEDMGDLFTLMNEVMHFQGSVCGSGVSRTIADSAMDALLDDLKKYARE